MSAPLRYRVRLLSAAHYDGEAPAAHHTLRVRPLDYARQRVRRFDLEVEPKPIAVEERRDFFGNTTLSFALFEPHEDFIYRAESEVEVSPLALPPSTPSWEDLRALALAQATLDARAPAHFMFASRIASLNDDITAYAALSFSPGAQVLDGARDLARRIHADFQFDAQATDVTSPPLVAFKARHGVCQDFAHIMISGMRGLGLPAAYASGYLRTIPPPGATRLEGADATHAWVMVWCGPDHGWIGVDPTNNLIADTDHILAAIGRDYADVAPETGVIVIPGEQTLETAVDVRALD